MAAITDGHGINVALPGVTGKSAVVPPSSPERSAGRGTVARSDDAGAVGRFGDLGRLWETRGEEWAAAVRIHQRDRQLGRLADRASETAQRLEQVKLYPPYPVNESRRTQAIREFNGLAAEARRLVAAGAAPAELGTQATTAEAEVAVAALRQLGGRVAGVRAEVSARFSVEAEVPAAESTSAEVGEALEGGEDRRLSRGSTDLLRQLV